MNKFGPLGLALLALVILEAPVEAYLDPGSGSMLVQLLLGGVAGAAVILRLGWLRLRSLFGGGQQKEPPIRSDD